MRSHALVNLRTTAMSKASALIKSLPLDSDWPLQACWWGCDATTELCCSRNALTFVNVELASEVDDPPQNPMHVPWCLRSGIRI
jgi:hypothetical protein